MKTEKLKRVNIMGIYILFSVLRHRIVSYIIFVLSSFYLVKLTSFLIITVRYGIKIPVCE